MKKLIVILVLFLAGGAITESQARYRNVEVNFGYFYNSLQPYGEWIEVDYDVYVWKPYRVARSWSPYSVGHWEYTSYGWYWESYEPFGWATYHYGRWYNDDYYGWVWVPGYEWGPSWVEWRYSNAYIGWSPLPPYAEFRMNVGIHFSISYRTSYHYWNFVSYNHFCRPRVHTHFVGAVYKNRIFNNTKYRTNYHARGGRIINGGIDRNYVERRAGTRIREREVARTTNLREYTSSRSNPADRGRIVSYRPAERETEKYRQVQTDRVKKDAGRSSLKRDMVTFRDREKEVRSRNERKSSRSDIRNPQLTDRSREDYKRKRNDEVTAKPGQPNVLYRAPDAGIQQRPKRTPTRVEKKTYERPKRSQPRETRSYKPKSNYRQKSTSVRERSSRNTRSTQSYKRPSRSTSSKSYRSSSRSSSSRKSAVKRSTSSRTEKSSSRSKSSSRGKKRNR